MTTKETCLFSKKELDLLAEGLRMMESDGTHREMAMTEQFYKLQEKVKNMRESVTGNPIIDELYKIPDYKKDPIVDEQLLKELAEEYPRLDFVKVARDMRYYVMENKVKGNGHRNRFRNFCRMASTRPENFIKRNEIAEMYKNVPNRAEVVRANPEVVAKVRADIAKLALDKSL